MWHPLMCDVQNLSVCVCVCVCSVAAAIQINGPLCCKRKPTPTAHPPASNNRKYSLPIDHLVDYYYFGGFSTLILFFLWNFMQDIVFHYWFSFLLLWLFIFVSVLYFYIYNARLLFSSFFIFALPRRYNCSHRCMTT